MGNHPARMIRCLLGEMRVGVFNGGTRMHTIYCARKIEWNQFTSLDITSRCCRHTNIRTLIQERLSQTCGNICQWVAVFDSRIVKSEPKWQTKMQLFSGVPANFEDVYTLFVVWMRCNYCYELINVATKAKTGMIWSGMRSKVDLPLRLQFDGMKKN